MNKINKCKFFNLNPNKGYTSANDFKKITYNFDFKILKVRKQTIYHNSWKVVQHSENNVLNNNDPNKAHGTFLTN